MNQMGKTAIIFPGQGAQKVGMAQDLYNNNELATEILTSAANTLDFDILETMFTDEDGKLGETENTQPALLTHSSALLVALRNLNPDYTMGHSLGEYSSLVAANVLSFEDAVKIVRKRGQLMAQAFPTGVGSMAAVLGLDYKEVDNICKSLSTEDKIIEPANINCPGQIVVSGHKELIDELVEKGKSLGAKRVMPLAVSGPFHSSLMKVIEEDFLNYINQFEWNDAKFPVVQNVNAQGETDKEVIKLNMVKQLYSPVQFIKSTEWLIDQGVDHFIEIGPGKVLSGLIKKINRDVKLTSIQTLEDVKGWNEND
ncbi:ACP S-malonyltransferase [Staphylococcus argenteus]|nr:ACP S-malonyltransferase [Staphylococcus argenteus]